MVRIRMEEGECGYSGFKIGILYLYLLYFLMSYTIITGAIRR